MNRKTELTIFLILILGITSACTHFSRNISDASQAKIHVGAIRWDAWYGDKDPVSQAVAKTLGPNKWHSRLPFFAREKSKGEVYFSGYTNEILDREIQYAKDGGIDYWTFVLYDENSHLSDAMNLYLHNANRKNIGFSVIVGSWLLQGEPSKQLLINRLSKLAAMSEMETVLNRRPIIYIYYDPTEFQNISEIESFFSKLRKSFANSMLAQPYVVVLSSDPNTGFQFLKKIGADALSAYAIHGSDLHGSFVELADYSERFWDREHETGASVIPTVMTGWDRRPRVEHPVPWENSRKLANDLDQFYERPTATELATHVQHAVTWARENQNTGSVNTILIYAWNEHDEGGWLVPGLLDQTSLLQAVKEGLK